MRARLRHVWEASHSTIINQQRNDKEVILTNTRSAIRFMVESLQHRKGKDALETIIKEIGFVSLQEEDLPRVMTTLGQRDYTADILAFKGGKIYVFEVDGKKGHFTPRDMVKMKLRDTVLLERFGIKTVRIKTRDLVGRKKQPVSLIIEDIEWQLSRQTTGKRHAITTIEAVR